MEVIILRVILHIIQFATPNSQCKDVGNLTVLTIQASNSTYLSTPTGIVIILLLMKAIYIKQTLVYQTTAQYGPTSRIC